MFSVPVVTHVLKHPRQVCTLNVIGDLTVTLKDLSGTIPGIMHHKVIDEGGYGKDITVGAALILDNVSVFTPKPSMYYLNITMRNVVKVFRKDTVLGSGSGIGGSRMLMEEEEIVKLMEEEEMVDLELQVCCNVTNQDKEALNLALEEEARQARVEQEYIYARRRFLMLNEPLTLQSNGNAVNGAFTFAHAKEEAFAGFLRDQCVGLWMTNNKNQMLIAELEVLGEWGDAVRIIPGLEGIFQVAKLLKQTDIQDCGEGCVMSTQEYIKKVVEDVGEDIKNFIKNGKLNQVVAIVKSCTSNVIGDLTVTLKDLSGTIPDTIHHKVIDDGGYGKDIVVRSALILDNVLVFTPKPSMYYLNIRMRNVVKVFHKDMVLGSGSGVGGSEMLMEEEEIVKLMEEE
ncbi:hypothetical protein Tco_0475527 [Tanacetum coccineum]